MKIKVNGKVRDVAVDGSTPLLWVLRDALGLTGTKFGCGAAQCGACVVHADGVAIRSCVTPAAAIGDRAVVTIEGLSEHGDHPLQQAWREIQVPQCGYCQAGQIMSAAALLAKNPSPTDDEIDRSMAGNICRCGTYTRVRAAIKKVASNGGGQ